MFETPTSVQTVADAIGAELDGDATLEVQGFAGLAEAGPTDLTFAADTKRLDGLRDSAAMAAIVSADAPAPAELKKTTLLRVPHVLSAVSRLLGTFGVSETLPPVGVDASAVVDAAAEVSPDAAIGPMVYVGPGCKIGPGTSLCAGAKLSAGVTVGRDCVIGENAVIRHHCWIGDRVRIGPCSVIGHDGFGYNFIDGRHEKVPHVGTVIVESDVEIAACSCVDRAKWGRTVIGAGTKIDNLVQVAHNVRLGNGCLLASQVGIAGSTTVGDFVVMGGHVGVRDNIEIGSGVQVGACTCIPQSVPPKTTLLGLPAREARQTLREWTAINKLPDLLKQVRTLQQRIEHLESATDHTKQ